MVAKAPINCETRVIQNVISLAPSLAPSCRNSCTCATMSMTALSGLTHYFTLGVIISWWVKPSWYEGHQKLKCRNPKISQTNFFLRWLKPRRIKVDFERSFQNHKYSGHKCPGQKSPKTVQTLTYEHINRITKNKIDYIIVKKNINQYWILLNKICFTINFFTDHWTTVTATVTATLTAQSGHRLLSTTSFGGQEIPGLIRKE